MRGDEQLIVQDGERARKRGRNVRGHAQNGRVASEVPTDAELRGNAALRQLVEAVGAADEHDEADWVEWKGPLDLATKPSCFHIARAVLGMANRDPERAALSAVVSAT